MYQEVVKLAKDMRHRESDSKRDADTFARMAKKKIEQGSMQVAQSYMERVNEHLDDAQLFEFFAECLENILEKEDKQ